MTVTRGQAHSTTSPDICTLVLEASTYAGSVALLGGTDVLHAADIEMRGRDEERLMPAVADCVSRLPRGVAGVHRVVCGAGPGSFTSLRIAASIAKGTCHAGGLPLYAVSSLALAMAASTSASSAGRYLVTLGAMRDELYASLFDHAEDGAFQIDPGVRIIAASTASETARDARAILLPGLPRAEAAARLLPAILGAGPVDIGSWEPAYGRVAEAQAKWEAAHGRPLKW